MSRLRSRGLLVASLSFLAACTSSESSSGPTGLVLTDTLGKTFQVSCSGGYCGLAPNDPSLKPLSCEAEYGATEAFALVWWTQILRVHAIQVPASGYISFNSSEPGHPIACVTDADCAPGLFSPAFTCQYGLCQYLSASTPMQTDDVIALCQADIPWPTSCPYLTDPVFAARMAEVAALCGPNPQCSKVPPDCRQPTEPASPPDASPIPTPPPADGGASALDTI